ncbi:MAG: MarR family winged helix-turn-helix transcriptional regulator [Bacteroidota bacterium]
MGIKGKHLGEFEEMVLLAVGVLGNEAYGISVKNKIEELTERSVSMGALHAALNRLEEKDFVKSKLGEATKVRGGKRKRFYSVTTFGQQEVTDLMAKRQQLWEAIPKEAFVVRWDPKSSGPNN